MTTTPDFAGDDGLVILDGSMGQELINSGAVDGTSRWATEGLLENPQAVVDLHQAYISSGVDIITTNSYSVSRDRFEINGVGDRLEELLSLAGELAVQARDRSDRRVRIAASLPPLQGSYRGDLARPYEVDLPLYNEIADHIGPYVELFIAETMTTVDEARAASDAARGRGKPVWVAWTVQNGGTSGPLSGETWQEAVDAVTADAYLINCSGPEQISEALPLLKQAAGDTPVGAYGNAFASMPLGWSNLHGDPLPAGREDIDADRYTEFVREWIDLGASIVGGCCEIGRTHMRHLCSALRP
ncbi:MAG: homocysteine S-methyltransferase family protein [Actinomycetota bacterium]|nr:homocysteine S-methyltransferase family protein [Actinomycetota bacterium]